MGRKYSEQEIKEQIGNYFIRIELESFLFSYSSFVEAKLLFYEEKYIVILEKICKEISIKNRYPAFFIENLYHFIDDYRNFYQKYRQKLTDKYVLTSFTEKVNQMIVQLNSSNISVSTVQCLASYAKKIDLVSSKNGFAKYLNTTDDKDHIQFLLKGLYKKEYIFLCYLLGETNFSLEVDIKELDIRIRILRKFINECPFLFYDYDVVSRAFEFLFKNWENISNFSVTKDPTSLKLNNIYKDVQKIYKKRKY